MSQRIVVFGAGAIGGVVAWRLARAGADVSLVGRGAALAAIGAQGLRLSVGELDERLKVPVVDLGAGLGREPPCEVLLLAVKAQDLPGALAAAAPLISPHTTVVPLVNGLPWWLFHGVKGPHAGPIEGVDPGGRLWQSLPACQVLGAVVHLGAEVVAPGWIRQAGDGRLTLGELDGSLSPRATALAALLEAGGLPTQVHPSIRDEVWSKLVGNGSSNPLSVVSGATLDRLFAEPGLRALVETVMLEIMALGAGLGVRFPMDVQARIAVGQRLGAFRTSMLQDFDLGRPLELGAIADAPLELAERLRVPMPTTRLVRDLARAAECSRDLRWRPPTLTRSPMTPPAEAATADAYDACNAGVAPPAGIPQDEWARRIELAGLYRVVHRLGWCDLIFNHITARVPGPARHFLINPFGLRYDEVTASNLVLIDLDGRPARPTPWPVNAAGFVVHGAVHRHRDDAHVVLHTHTREGMAVACKAEGLSHDSFYGAMLTDEVAYHPFEGVSVHEGEMERLAASLGQRHMMILRNHGLLTCGPDVPTGFFAMWLLQRACETQCDAQALTGPPEILSAPVRERTRQDRKRSRIDPRVARTVLAALRREVDAGLTVTTDYRR